MNYDLMIRGGTVIDGRRTPRFRADIGIVDGHIATIGRIAPSRAHRCVDADGLIVAPGVIDLHTHYDSQVFWDPWCAISGQHGVTSVVIGNCGFGFAPVQPTNRERAMLAMARNEAVPLECMREGMPWDWTTYPEFLDSLERTSKGLNLMAYIGINPLMVWVTGSVETAKARGLNPAEREIAATLLREAMDAGACGWSAQLTGDRSIQRDYDGTPMITDLMRREDLVFLARTLGDIGRGTIQMIGPPAMADMLAAESGRPVIFNTLAPRNDQHGAPAEAHHQIIDWLARANGEGRRIIAQSVTCAIDYQFTLEDWNLFDSSPLWRDLTLGTISERLAKMRDPARRRALLDEWNAGKAPLAGGGTEELDVRLGVSIDALVLAWVTVEDPELKRWEGHTVREIAAGRGQHPLDAFLDIAIACDLAAGWQSVPRDFDPDVMRDVANCPYAVPGLSDGGAHTRFLTTGTYPTEFLATWVRDNQVMDLEQAHWRLSAYSAQAAGMRNRGWLAEGMPADIVVYELDRLALHPIQRVHDWPGGAWHFDRKADGWRIIMVNGEITFVDGVCTGATPGRLLRHGQG
ncbi:MAG: amidohydrolase family protein [Pseudomonadales bacterium]|nr:amidohydrolase family protein [Pseudomonadales bacterium]MCP5186013.1 amidohydrolase family protein [Pseudomonadales bacterium]